MTATVTPIWDGDPNAPDATPTLVGATVTVRGDQPTGMITVRLSDREARHLWGQLGDLLHRHYQPHTPSEPPQPDIIAETDRPSQRLARVRSAFRRKEKLLMSIQVKHLVEGALYAAAAVFIGDISDGLETINLSEPWEGLLIAAIGLLAWAKAALAAKATEDGDNPTSA